MAKQTGHPGEKPSYEVVWPLGRLAAEPLAPSAPIPDLTGKTVGELWDGLFRGDEMFHIIREKLRQRYPGIKFVDHTVFGSTHGKDETRVIENLPGELRKHGCDLAISAVGA
jgi:hypothetical protein